MNPDTTDLTMVGLVIVAAFLYVIKTMLPIPQLLDTIFIVLIILLSAIAIGYLITRWIKGK